MTKNELCWLIVNRFRQDKGAPIVEADIYGSSQLAVAMEHLGLLKSKQSIEYAQERGGTVFIGDVSADQSNDIQTLSLRTILGLLPDG